jgi:hypothetical protein
MKIRFDKSQSCAGFALILVMIVVISLTAMVATFALSMNTEIRLARNSDYDAEMEWMGRSGIELAEFQLANKCPEQRNIDALNQTWAGGTALCSNQVSQIGLSVDLDKGRHIDVKITDMERKWDINVVANPRQPQIEILQKALLEIGVTDQGQAETIQDSILDWINPNSTSSFNGAKDDYYLKLTPPYYCKDGNIDDLSELLLIKGVTPEIYWGSFSSNHSVSAFQEHGSGSYDQPVSTAPAFRNSDRPVYPVGLNDLFSPLGGKLNVNTASIQTLQLIPGMEEAAAEQIIRQRAGPDGVDGTDDDVPFQNIGEINGGMPGGGAGNVQGAPPIGGQAQALGNYIDVRSFVFKVQVNAEINGYKRTFYGIVSRTGNGGQALKCIKFYWE